MSPSPFRALAMVLVLGLARAAPPEGGSTPLTQGWATAAAWDDGLAEVAVYAATRTIYEAPRPYEAVLITVKEDLGAAAGVKADPPTSGRALVTVLKHNVIREIPTPNYDYRMMTSVFVERSDPSRVLKLTHGSQEWCGNTWTSLRVREGAAQHDWSSYFDGEGDGTERLALGPGDWLEDQLGVTLRGLDFRPGLEMHVRLAPSLATNHAGPLRLRDATIRVASRETARVPAGAIDAWRVEVRGTGLDGTWWFDAAGTHPLVRMENARGERLELRHIERRAYWRRSS